MTGFCNCDSGLMQTNAQDNGLNKEQLAYQIGGNKAKVFQEFSSNNPNKLFYFTMRVKMYLLF